MNDEYNKIVNKIIKNKQFLKLKDETHHCVTNRYEHCKSVSYLVYKTTKKLNMDYISATRASLMHDFFYNNEFNTKKDKLFKHPSKSLENALKISNLNEKEKNIISSHMFPFGGKLPKYKESVLVDLIDDFVAVKERTATIVKYASVAFNFIIVMFLMKK